MDKKKKILMIVVLILFIVLLFLAYLVFSKFILKKDFENSILPFANNNEETIFNIDQIILFSNCDAKNKNISRNHYTLENIYQYTDMAFFINSPQSTKTAKNTLKAVSIKNISYISTPKLGQPNLYFKSLNNFAKSELVDENKINNELNFSISSSDDTDLNTPILYNNLANPITISYINSNIKNDYTITDTSTAITYDGSLLQKCNVNLEDLKCNFSFDVYITNQMDEKYKCTVFVDIPLTTENSSLIDGNIVSKQNVNLCFYRYE